MRALQRRAERGEGENREGGEEREEGEKEGGRD